MRILIADDEPRSGRLLAELLPPLGHEPVLVHDGLAALEVLRAADAPRLALLDWQMPGLDGIRVCREVRKAAADQPYTYLVLVTGHGGRQDMFDGLEAGADDFLVKPVDPCALKARLVAARRIITLQEKLRELATRDALTGLWNRAAILNILDRELNRSRREGGPLSVVLADLDHFKRINDTHGHLDGDRVLQQAAQRMPAALRPYDAVGRYGGEEFLIVLPGCGAAAAKDLAERLRRGMGDFPVDLKNGPLAVTCSLGIAACSGAADGVSSADLLRTADEALYKAKAAGRNRAFLATGSDDGPRSGPRGVARKVAAPALGGCGTFPAREFRAMNSEELRQQLEAGERHFSNADLHGADLAGSNLRGADLQGADLCRADLHGADLEDAEMAGADLAGADLVGANLAGANLAVADLNGAVLTEANLQGANLAGTDLHGSDLTNANLQRADLREADLRLADLKGANLREANLRGADLTGTSLPESHGAGLPTD